MNYKVSSAVMAILSIHAGRALADTPVGEANSATGGLQEIIVTAQRRSESIQNVPITVQALTGDSLAKLNVTTFDDAVKFLPNVNTNGTGPAQSNIIIRGLATQNTGTQAAGIVGSFPNVAVYLDEQSGQLPGRNLDVYVADLERIEVLEGPQGTLFGAGAQAGVVRYITNKPKLNVTEGSVNAGYATTAHGDKSTNVDAMINLPLIQDRLAVRGVIYDESRGGYISNIPATFSRAGTDRNIATYFGGVVPPNVGPINNYNLAQRAFNPVTYKGYRLQGALKLNEDWNVLLSQSYQKIDSEGVFWEEEYDGTGRTLPDLSVEQFNPNYNHDEFNDTQLTIDGRIDWLKVVYAGGYLTRNVRQQEDLTNYSRGVYAGYYQCNYPGYPFVNGKPTTHSPGYCWTPSGFWTDHERASHLSQELRLSTPDDWRVRAIAGLFYEKYTIREETDWYYGSSPNFYPVGPPSLNPYVPATGTPPQYPYFPVTSNNPNLRPAGDMFFDDITRGYNQKAVFGSVDFDLIPKSLTLTLGTRYYDTTNFEVGSNVGSFGCEIGGPYGGGAANPCVSTPATGVLSNLNNLNAKTLNTTYKGFRSRANLTWRIDPDKLVYYTWSQGFRPGGFNRAQSIIKPGSPLYGVFTPPLAYAPDYLTNNEIGWKTEWFDHHLQWNGAVYREDWNNVQITVFDPGVTGNLIFTTNGPNYRVKGVETSFVARITKAWTVTAAGAWNTSSVVKTLNLAGSDLPNPFGELGSPLAQCPPFEGNLHVRYEIPVGDYQVYVQAGVERQGGSYASTDRLTTTLQGQSVAFYDPGFTTYDASAGVSKDQWTVQVYGENISDTRGTLFSNYNDFVKENIVNRPRTIGLRFSYHFTGK